MVATRIFKRQQLISPAGEERYVLIDGKVYEISNFVSAHPGGAVILTHANGEDASDVFAAFHPESAYETLADFYAGDLDSQEWVDLKSHNNQNEFAREIDALRRQFHAAGLFDSSKAYYLFKVLFNYAILATSVWALSQVPGSSGMLARFGWIGLSGALMAVFWQQSGWLAHDFLHHQVFDNRTWNNAMGYLLGNIGQGFSVSWWKNKHNSHHASPNVDGLDPDIDTMPILGWSEHALKQFEPDSWMARFLMLNQANLYFVILTFARLAWAQQSLTHALQNPNDNMYIEVSTLSLHWGLYFGLMVAYLTPLQALGFFFISQAICGFLLAVVFSLNHNGMPILSQEESIDTEFYRKQILTGRDIHPTLFSTWFTGGLNYQIEHHLFPTLPRHNFHLIQPHVRALCKKYQVPYHVTDMSSGTMEVLNRLDAVTLLARQMMH